MKKTLAALLVAFAFANGTAAVADRADDTLSAKLEADRIGAIEPGIYEASDSIRFTLTRWKRNFLLRFIDDPETYVLSAGHAPMGGRVLKYDTGATALTVSGWGGLTLYTDAHPAGLPALRLSDADAAPPVSASLADVEAAASDESAHLHYVRDLTLTFVADWDNLARRPTAWTPTFEALCNAARGIEHFTATPRGREVLMRRVSSVRLQDGTRPALLLSGRTLVVTFDSDAGFAGRASSRAIEDALDRILDVRNSFN